MTWIDWRKLRASLLPIRGEPNAPTCAASRLSGRATAVQRAVAVSGLKTQPEELQRRGVVALLGAPPRPMGHQRCAARTNVRSSEAPLTQSNMTERLGRANRREHGTCRGGANLRAPGPRLCRPGDVVGRHVAERRRRPVGAPLAAGPVAGPRGCRRESWKLAEMASEAAITTATASGGRPSGASQAGQRRRLRARRPGGASRRAAQRRDALGGDLRAGLVPAPRAACLRACS
jgi:hypothetical protein